MFSQILTVRRLIRLNAHGYLTCSLERSGYIGHGYESSEARGDHRFAVKKMRSRVEKWLEIRAFAGFVF